MQDSGAPVWPGLESAYRDWETLRCLRRRRMFRTSGFRLSLEVTMIPAVDLRRQRNVQQMEPSPSRGKVLARYRHLRAISKVHHARAMKFLATSTIMQQARRLRLSNGRRLILGSMDELTLAFDLAIHTAPAGRTRAIDRYARRSPLPEGSDEALVLDAMRNARFAILTIERRHEAAGLVAADLFRDEAIWLVDEGLETSLPDGTAFATRCFTPAGFSMTAGVGMPVDSALVVGVMKSAPHLMRKPPAEVIDDPRFAEGVYRAAIREGIMEGMTFQDVDDAECAA